MPKLGMNADRGNVCHSQFRFVSRSLTNLSAPPVFARSIYRALL